MSNNGYEYRYKFSINDAIIPSHEDGVVDGFKIFQFEIRTNFTVAKIDGADEIIGSETFDACVPACFDSNVPAEESSRILYEFVHQRLKGYKMNWQEIEDFAEAADRFAQRCTVDPRYRYTVPVVVSLDVCTVQRKSEALDDAMKRAIRGAAEAEAEALDWVDTNTTSLPDAWMNKSDGDLVELCPVCLEELVYESRLKKEVCPVCGSLHVAGGTSSQWRRRWRSFKSVIRGGGNRTRNFWKRNK